MRNEIKQKEMKKVIFKINQHGNFSFNLFSYFLPRQARDGSGRSCDCIRNMFHNFLDGLNPSTSKLNFSEWKLILGGGCGSYADIFNLLSFLPLQSKIHFECVSQNVNNDSFATWRDRRARPPINAKPNFFHSFRTFFPDGKRAREMNKIFFSFHSFLSWRGNLTMRSWCPKSVIIDPNDGNMIFGVICWLISERSSFTSCFTQPSFTSHTSRAPVTNGN